jgi:hypothetical protein
MGSRPPGPENTAPFGPQVSRTPGPLGSSDFADPDFWNDDEEQVCRVPGTTPGPLGTYDYADPSICTLPGEPNVCLIDELPQPATPQPKNSGKITFDAEGNDNETSPHFSRVVHWPGNDESGVTLGRGYDMGNRSSAAVEADLVAAGVGSAKAKEFAKGAGKKGQKAKTFVKDNKATLGQITREQQQKLFDIIYPKYVERAKLNYEKWTVDEAGAGLDGKVKWENLDAPIRDILVDFVYQGFTKGPNPMVAGMRNDYDELIKYIENTPAIKQYEAGRKRADYLKTNRPKK